jgi:hypothetical protein
LKIDLTCQENSDYTDGYSIRYQIRYEPHNKMKTKSEEKTEKPHNEVRFVLNRYPSIGNSLDVTGNSFPDLRNWLRISQDKGVINRETNLSIQGHEDDSP